MKKIFLLTVLLANLLFAINEDIVERKISVNAKEKVEYQNKLENNIARELQNYLGGNRFLLDLDVDLVKINKYKIVSIDTLDPISFLASRTPTESYDNFDSTNVNSELLTKPIEDLFDDNGKFDEKLMSEDIITDSPEPKVKIINEEYLIDSNIEIQSQKIKIMLDESMELTRENEDFIKDLISQKAQINIARGDILQIRRIEFIDPVQEKKEEPKDEHIPQLEMPKIEPIVQKTWWEENQLNLLWFLMALLFVLIIYLLLRKNTTNYKEKVEEKEVIHNEGKRTYSKDLELEQSLVEEKRYENLKQHIINQGLLDKNLANKLHTMYKTEQAHKQDLVKIFRDVVGKDLFESIMDDTMSKTDLINIEYKYNNETKNLPILEKIVLANELLSTLAKNYKTTDGDMKLRLFGFLEKLSFPQLVYLFKMQNDTNKAIILSQVDKKIASEIISTLSKEDQVNTISLLGSMRDINMELLQAVAQKLAKDANSIPEITNIIEDGEEMVVSILDRFDYVDEINILKTLEKENPDLYLKIKKIHIMFDDIIFLEKHELTQILRSVDFTDIAIAIYDCDESFKKIVYESLPTKTQLVVQSLINEQLKPTKEEIDIAKRAITKKARDMKKNRFLKNNEVELA